MRKKMKDARRDILKGLVDERFMRWEYGAEHGGLYRER